MKSVFISYSRTDHFFAQLAQIKLRDANIPVWMDDKSLLSGEDWREGIDLGIKESPVILVAISQNSANSSYVTYEWSRAMGGEENKVIIPIRLDDSKVHPRLEVLQQLDFSVPHHQPWPRLIERIKSASKEFEEAETDAPVLPIRKPMPSTAKRSAQPSKPVSEPVSIPEAERAADEILGYLNDKGFQMVSFDRIKEKISQDYSEDFLDSVVTSHPEKFRPAMLKGGKIGVKRL